MNGAELRRKVGRGFWWSALSTSLLRLGSLITGIALARILLPSDYGAFAVALMVQAIVINLAELGLAADLVRHGDIERRGPTITTIALASSGLLTVLMWTTAPVVARLMGAPEATSAIQLMSLTLPLAGLTAAPYAVLQRDFRQAQLFGIDLSNFVLGTGLTILLALGGWGPLSLAIGRVAGQLLSTLLQFRLTRCRLRFGWDPAIARTGLRFGFPLACAGVLSWTLLNVDTMIVGSGLGAVSLGFYVLAFNVASWPSSVIGTAVRAVAFPAFARRSLAAGQRDAEGLVRATGLVWAASVPVAVALVLLSRPVISVLYGDRWSQAAPVLAALGLFGCFRVVFDLWIAYYTACGASGRLLLTQVLWLVALTPVMYVGVRWDGLRGAGWAHVAVAALVMLPIYLTTLSGLDVRARALLAAGGPAVLAVLPAAAVGWGALHVVHGAWAELLLAGPALALTYLLCLLPWLRRQRAELRASVPTEPDPPRPALGVPATTGGTT